MIKLCTNCYWLGTKFCCNQYYEDDKIEEMKLCDEHNFKCSCKHGVKDEKEMAEYEYDGNVYCKGCLFDRLGVNRKYTYLAGEASYYHIGEEFLCNINEDVIHDLVKIGYKIEELEY